MKIVYDGGYGRDGEIEIREGKCLRCQQTALCLRADSSEGEYDPVVICKKCIDILFEEAERYEGGRY